MAELKFKRKNHISTGWHGEIPNDTYDVQIEAVRFAPLNMPSGGPSVLTVVFSVLNKWDGPPPVNDWDKKKKNRVHPHEPWLGRRVSVLFEIEHPNPIMREIEEVRFSELLDAVGLEEISSAETLWGRDLRIRTRRQLHPHDPSDWITGVAEFMRPRGFDV